MLKLLWKSCLTTAVSVSLAQSALAVEVDLLLLYDDFTASRYNGDPSIVMTSWVENANQAYAESEVDIQLRLVGLEEYTPSSQSMSARLTEIRQSAEVSQLRNEYGADFVSLIASRDGNICGIGNFAVSSYAAFNVTGIQCGYLTLIHELGHNMGLGHSRRQGDRGGARYSYGLGYGVDRTFSTVMAYPQAFSSRKRLNRFSDPDRTCEGLTCGVAIGQPEQADAHTALNNVKLDVANFRQRTVDNGNGGNSLQAPSGLGATSASEDSIRLSWRDNSSEETQFVIQRSRQSDSGFTQVATAPSNSTNYIDAGLTAGTTFYYRVRALSNNAQSSWSNTTTATTKTPTTSVPAPSNLGARIASNNNIALNWKDNSRGEDYFQIQRSDDSGAEFKDIARARRGETNFLDSNLSPGTYYYRIKAHISGMDSSWSNSDSAIIVSDENPPTELLDLSKIGLQLFTNQYSRNASAYLTNNVHTLVLRNNVWLASSSMFDIDRNTILEFDYSSNVSGEIHGIGFDEDSKASSNRIFKLGGSQNWGISDYAYIGDGEIQSFQIPVGQYFTGRMKLVLANDNDKGSGNVSYFSNIRIINGESGDLLDSLDIFEFGLEYINHDTAIIYHIADIDKNTPPTLCVNDDCGTAERVNNRYEREVEIKTDQSYLIEYRTEENDSEQCVNVAIVDYTKQGAGVKGSNCK
ncbi:zinc-dependent metalloprotease family protein [Agaribacterium sp. ZY112]|uniref:zinc-dependent metalloprotease family protein n=1 Tax=Agaribacterium sp. ZY112 TaxID=3233574 RepID=UPI003523590D